MKRRFESEEGGSSELTKIGYEEVASSGGNGGSIEARLSEYGRQAFIPITETGDISVSSSKFSGIAWINCDEEWPTCGYCENPMQLFFQLNLKDAPARRSYWPESGYIQVFYCNTSDTYCEECGDDAYTPFGKYQAARLVTPSAKAKSFSESPVEGPIPARTIIKWKEKLDYPCSEELASCFDDPILDEDELSEMFEVSMEESEKSLTYVSDKLGGWPMWVQSAKYPDCPTCETTMDFIVQIGSEDNLDYMFGDCGIAMVFQCCKHPAQLAFSWEAS